MKKQLLSILLCLSIVVALLPAVTLTAYAAETVTYIDAQGNTQTASATQITSSSTTLIDSWYYVSGKVEISSTVVVSPEFPNENINLILTDGCELTVKAPSDQQELPGIRVPCFKQLTIYAQSDGENMGKLSASTTHSQSNGAGIGSSGKEHCGTITIVGGNVTATGGTAGAGIGGGSEGNGGTVNISGGIVTATGGDFAAGIGGGYNGFGGKVNISGGSVKAFSYGSAGIGGGYYGSGGEVNISGGIVHASSSSGVGIGGQGSAGIVSITGGKVTALSEIGSGIGGGNGGLVLITNGTVTAASVGASGYSGAGIGGHKGGTVIITGGSVKASSARGEPIGHDSSGTDSGTLTNGIERLYPTTVTLDGVSSETAVSALTSSAAYYGATDMKTDAGGRLYLYLPEGSTVSSVTASGNTYTGPITVAGSPTAGTLYMGTPVVSSVSLPANSIYKTGNTLSFTVHFSKAVMVTGSPYISLTIGDSTVQAAYQSGSGTSSLVFSYTIQSEDKDLDGIGIGGSIELNGGTVKDLGDISSDLTLNGAGTTSGILVGDQTLTVTISSTVSSPTNSTSFPITITFSQPVTLNQPVIFTDDFIMSLIGSGTTYTAEISHTSEGDITVVIPKEFAWNAAGVYNSASNEFHMKIDRASPSVSGVTPGDGAVNVASTGDITVTFSEPINTASGTVTLIPRGGSPAVLTGGTWSNENKTYTLSGGTLAYGTTYSLAVSGFTDLAGNVISSVWSGSFTTEPEPLKPSVSPGSLSVYRDGTASLSVALGQGTDAASQAAVTVSDGSKISVTPALLSANGSIVVTGLAAGQADITIVFDDSAHTSKTISVMVENAPPVWPTGSSLGASRVTQNSVLLNWTAANSTASVTGYKIYRDGKLIGFSNAAAFSYTVSGLSASTAYSFQVQAGNTDDAWSKDGPTFAVTTKAVSPDDPSLESSPASTFINGSHGTLGTVNITTSGSSVSAALSAAQGSALPSGDILELTIPSVKDAASYSVKLPANNLYNNNSGGTLTMKTDLGSIVMPSNMLSSLSNTSDKTAEITIGRGSKSYLPEGVKNAIGDRPLVQLRLSINGSQTDWSNPDAPVTVSIPYTPTAEELANSESIVIWYIDGAGKIVTVPNGHYDLAAGTVTFSATHFSQYAVGYNNVAFSDVPDNAWYFKAVSFIAARGITDGTSNTAFSPDVTLTRGQFIMLLMRTYGIEPEENAADNFTDAGNTYYSGYLAAAKRLGISSGVGDNRFAPEQVISRQQMFTLIYNGLKEINQLPDDDSGKTLSDFTDGSSISAYAQEALDYFVKTGIVSGNNGLLLPTATTTRAQMAQILYNLLGN